MNILIPHRWLLEHLETQANPATIQKDVSLCGPSIERLNQVLGDAVYDIEVTTNRVDSMSVRGVAQEAAAILPEFGVKAVLKPLKLTTITKTITSPKLPPLDIKVINNDGLSHRILAIKLTNVHLKPSPRWLRERLEQVGQRAINNVIDITNYIMWEMGHPVHAFDYDKLTRKTIIVRVAKKGEKLTTLDHKTHSLSGGEVVFDDGTGEIIDLPGIMGTANTVVSDDTTNVLLWIESIDAVKIRQASMGMSIRSQAAILNEKGVDPNLALPAIARAVELYQAVCRATLGSKLLDIYPHPQVPKTITLTQVKLDSYLGLHIKPKRVAGILNNLGCQVSTSGQTDPFNTLYKVTPPSSRTKDLTIYQDLIEEVARIYGYHHLPSQVMPTSIPDTPTTENFDLELAVKNMLVGFGANEVYTYSMVSEALATRSGYALSDHLKIKNPLIDDFVYLRRSLVPSLMAVFADNPGQKLTVFEMQNVFHPKVRPTDLPQEQLQLCILSNHSYEHLKGVVDALLQKLYLNAVVVPAAHSHDHFSHAAGQIMSGDQVLGYIGKIKHSDLYAAVFDFAIIERLAHSHPTYLPVITSAPIIEDLTFALPTHTYIGQVISAMKAVSPLIFTITQKDLYRPANADLQNITFTLVYRHPKQTLSVKDIVPIRKKVVLKLKKVYRAELIGSI